MAKKILNETDIRNVIVGATVIGAGGGGSISCAYDMLDNFKASNPEKPVQLELIDPKDMAPGAYAAVTAGMGAPRALVGVDFTPFAVNAFETLTEMAADMGRKLQYCIPVEIGGFNTFVPMLISLLKGVPLIDADGAGRAVPALDTLLLHINGLDTSPLAMADDKNNRLKIELADTRDASMGENIGRWICTAFDMKAGLSGWMVTKDEILTSIANNSVSYAMSIGETIAKYDGKGNVYDFIAKNSDLPCKPVCTGKITKMETKTANGFDYGVAIIAGEDGHEYKIPFQNENLAIYKNGTPLMTVPDIISVFNKETGMPMTNADTAEGQYVDVGIARVDEKWWKVGEAKMNEIWKPYFSNVEYTGKIIRYPAE